MLRALAFAREMADSGTVESIRAEEGSLRYEYGFAGEASNDFLFQRYGKQ